MGVWTCMAASIRRMPAALGLILCVALAQPADFALAATSTLTVAKSGSGTGTVTASAGAINCGVTCSGSYTDGVSVTLTGSPTAGSQFTGWLGPCTGTGACTFVVNGSTTISVTFAAEPLTGPALDIDGDGHCDALSDGLLVIRYLLGQGGSALINGVVGPGAARNSATVVGNYLADVRPLLDIDGDGQLSALTDGLLAARYFFGLRGTPLIAGALGTGATRMEAGQVEAQIQTLCSPPPPTICDSGLASNSTASLDYAKALGLCATTTEGGTASGVISATFSLPSGTGTPDVRSRAIRQTFGTNNLPQAGEAMVVLSTGAAAVPGQINPSYVAPQPGLNTTLTSTAPADWLSANGNAFPNAPGCPPPSGGAVVYDPTMLTLRIRVPLNANAFKVSSKFLSSEFPEYVCSPYNDFFVVLLDSGYSGPNPNPGDKNLAIYKTGALAYPFGVNLAYGNTGLFTQCVNGPTGCTFGAVAGSITTCTGTSGLIGTGLDLADPGKCDASAKVGGGTDWLQIRGNVVPGEIITLRFAIWDTSDGTYDSTVLLDNFTWLPANVMPGAFP